ncbi:MAG: glycosyltransferase [Candidatus Glassbacteria bacterium]|nr:glycosyltransferase [Candidatus Glassbacteria bacterium]
MEPEVSYLMPACNAAGTIDRAVRSLLAQRNCPSLEVVVVDDGSTDGTRELVTSLAAGDSRVRCVAEPHRGQVAAAVIGQELCRGKYIARLDADDIAHPDRTALQVAMLENDPLLGVVGCRVRYFPRREIQPGLLFYENWLNSLVVEDDKQTRQNILRELFVECPLANPSLMMRACAFREIGGYRDFDGMPEDYDLLFRFAASRWDISAVPEVLHYWRNSVTRASRVQDRYSAESFQRLKFHYLLKLRLESGRRPVSICGAGPVGKSWLKLLQKTGVEIRCLVEVNPRKIGKTIHGVPVVDTARLAGNRERAGLILGAVGQKGARGSVRAQLDPLGFVEGRDYIFIA